MGRSGKAVFDPKKGNDMTRSNFISYFLDSTLEAISRIGDHANYSWLEATPPSHRQQWERHLAAICEYVESV